MAKTLTSTAFWKLKESKDGYKCYIVLKYSNEDLYAGEDWESVEVEPHELISVFDSKYWDPLRMLGFFQEPQITNECAWALISPLVLKRDCREFQKFEKLYCGRKHKILLHIHEDIYDYFVGENLPFQKHILKYCGAVTDADFRQLTKRFPKYSEKWS